MEEGVKLVMHQIEQLIHGLLAAQEKAEGEGRKAEKAEKAEGEARRSSFHSQRSQQLTLPGVGVRRSSLPNINLPGIPPVSDEVPSPPSAVQVETPKGKKPKLNPQLSKLSFASQASHQSRQITPSDENLTSERTERTRLEHGDACFQLHPAWAKRQKEQLSVRLSKIPSQAATHSTMLPIVQKLRQPAGWLPDWRLLWTLAAAGLIFFDCVSIPLLAFKVQEPWAFDLVRIIFWTLSLPKIWRMSGGCVRSRWPVASLEGLLEVVLVALIFCTLVQSGLSAKVQFLFRGPELLRLRYFTNFYGLGGLPRWLIRWSRGELQRLQLRAAANIFYTLVACMIGVHLLTCAWFAAGQAEAGWAASGDHGELLGRSVLEQYRISLEWAISRIPPSQTTDNVLLATQLERVIALTATATSLLAASMFTSIVTNDMSDIRRVQRQQGEADCQLSDFLETFPVSWALERQLKAYLKQTVKRVSLPNKREMATLLPDLLHGQLCCEALGAVIGRHQMLAGLMLKYPSFQRDLCVKGLEDWTVSPDEVLFSAGLACQNMLFVAFNMVLYKRRGIVTPGERSHPQKAKTFTLRHGSSWNSVGPAERPVAMDNQALRIHSGHWLCEPCLWTEWRYLGQAVAGSCTSLLCLNLSQLLSITAGHADISAELVIHARLFLNALNEMPEEELSDVQYVL
ncbi:unnamed protein product [Symbiodinium natans]|uniref:Ion transport domain-containing protein n=1 Tax=Symbiodinium natans TaxID=878477 RepID=A0A812LL94_9DINO|nr:unnamed protein product [Symbiodinium natans]